MAGKSHKIKARTKDSITEVKLLVQHPMETGNRRNPVTGIKIPRDFIRELRCELNGVEVLSCDWGWGVSRNPFLAFRIIGAAAGDAIVVTWVDNLGVADSVETQLK